MQDRKDQVLLGDDFLKRDVYKATMEKINTNKLKKIVIIGGSHSGFSAAWLMLNGPATY
jgi:6-phosphofructokinase